MVFYAGKLVLALNNPTLVVLTDRNDLDDQLFDTFSLSQDLLRQTPVQAENRDHLKSLLSVSSGGIVFTTIQKFLPEIEEKIDLGDGKTKNIKGQLRVIRPQKHCSNSRRSTPQPIRFYGWLRQTYERCFALCLIYWFYRHTH
jgi:type I restriction enzyme, R subunit